MVWSAEIHYKKEVVMRDGEPSMYIGLATLRNGYMQMQWSRVQMFLLFNTVALPLVFGSGQAEIMKAAISAIGTLVHILLLNAVIRANGWIEFLDAKLTQLEQLDQDDQNGARVFVFSDPSFAEKRNGLLASRKLFMFIGLGTTILWIEKTIQHYILFLTS